MKSIKILAAAAAFCFVGQSFATDWYVSPNGKNKNEGKSTSAPLKNIWKAIELASDGDVIRVAAGNYNGQMKQGWIKLDKPVSIIGGYSNDFSSRDVVKNKTLFQPTNEMNGTKGQGILHLNYKGANSKVVIDGFIFDQGEANSYHPVEGKPEGVETGMWLEPPSKGNTTFPSLNNYSLYGENSEGDLTIQNCVFVNAGNIALNLNHVAGKVKVLNNIFIANRIVGANVQAKQNKVDAVDYEFAYNTVMFTWTRTKLFEDMGYGVRANTNCITRVHNNILALNMMAGFDNTKGDPKSKKVYLNKNAFILNKKGDVTVTVSPNILWLNVADGAFEDLEDAPSIQSLNGNISISDPSIFKGKINQAYLEGFLNATYTEQASYNENSPANLFRAAMGLNKQGSIKSKVSMFMNKYPMEEALNLFGLMEGYGAQKQK